jgi:hypothetical protein
MDDGDKLVALGVLFIKTVGVFFIGVIRGFRGRVCSERSWDSAEVKKSCMKGTLISRILIISSTFFTQFYQKTLNQAFELTL